MKTKTLTNSTLGIMVVLFIMNSIASGQWTLSGNKVYTTSNAYYVGIGTGSAMNAYMKLAVKQYYNTSNPAYGIYVDIKNSRHSAGNVYGVYTLAESAEDENSESLYGVYAKATSSTGVRYVYGGYFEAAGTVNQNLNYGLYVKGSLSGPAQSYGIYVEDGYKNYFEKKVGIGTTSPQEKLDVNGTTRTKVIKITGGSDLAEPFAVNGTEEIKPGMVVSIDPEQSGQLRVSGQAYDRTVAGIISGAGGVNPGIMMAQTGEESGKEYPLALSGRVYAWADASSSPVKPGDLLTTSSTPGHVMKVTDHMKAQGAIIGKAMSALEEGQGLVLVLVALQ